MTECILSVALFLKCCVAEQSLRDPPTTERVRSLASSREDLSHYYLRKYRESAFPAYRAILSDPDSDAGEVTGVLSALCFVKAPATSPLAQFHPLVVPYLSHKDRGIRYGAVCVMKQIGTSDEGAILVALLSDENMLVADASATVLARVGGRRELLAMDAWLQTGTAHRGEGDYLIHVKKCRDEIEQRLKDNPLPKGIMN